ncbi:MAG: ABC transporter ATP-binding protein [Sinobacteraceae bacterium]|nr:ABC transporter ATP-binding protein [Nevskiaceae bacterium]MCP5338731.1 ABC transporter ATP-binding protein [Nevskiaceae bacterium]MCP5360876.1 ABC transporter ATP-binding protein [Nevskiaceae bacterium]
MSISVIEIRGLCVDYALASGVLRAVDDVSFTLSRQEVLGIAGESGSGKSSIALALLGLLDSTDSRTRGSVDFDGQSLIGLDEAGWRGIRGRRIGAVFQSPRECFNPTMTIGQHFEDALREHFGLSRQLATTRTLEALERVRMPRAREVISSYAFELSGGMCQRAALALALVLEPAVLIADEPTASLDLLAQVDIARLLAELRTELGLAMLVISHDLGLIGRLADRVAIMHKGRIVETGPTVQVFREPTDAYTRELLAACRPASTRSSMSGTGATA